MGIGDRKDVVHSVAASVRPLGNLAIADIGGKTSLFNGDGG